MDKMKLEMEAKEDEFVAKLESEGHACVIILETYPSQTRWCKKTPCIKSLASQNP
jgi:hypothetical protein